MFLYILTENLVTTYFPLGPSQKSLHQILAGMRHGLGTRIEMALENKNGKLYLCYLTPYLVSLPSTRNLVLKADRIIRA